MAYEVEVPCSVCGILHKKVLPNKASALDRILSGKKKTFCSPKCRKEYHNNKRPSFLCKHCNNSFKSSPSLNQKFCSYSCYYEHMSNHPEEYNLFEKARNMSKYANTERSVEKGKETKVKNGVMVDWKDATWKQFWRKCNNLTRKKRQELLESWDGYDYIDGEYIRSYLDLPYFHKNYPTLDHVKPRSAFFKEGRTPEEACASENLKWTKRTNNSRKYNRYDT